MKLYIKQKVFSWKDKFTVKDESGADRYIVEGAVFSLGKRLNISDAAGNELGSIQQKVMALKPRYCISYGGQELGEVVKKISLKPKFELESYGWEIEGNFFDYTFEIRQAGTVIAHIATEMFTWGDSYVIDVADPANEYVALAVMLAIDCANDAGSSDAGLKIGGVKIK